METGFFQKLTFITNKKQHNKYLIFIIELVLFFILLRYRTDYNLNGIVDGLLALVIACIVHTVLINIPVVSPVCRFIGKYSLNIFLFHTLLYSYYFLGFFFSFRYWVFIVLALLVVSLLVSVGIETIKKKIGYMKRMEKAGQKLLSFLE